MGERRTNNTSETARDLRSYGRRRGRTPSPRQAALLHHALPKLALRLGEPAPGELARLFPVPVSQVWLEIGFGGGEHLIWQAKANPNVGLIGCEPFQDGIIKVLSAIDTQQLANVRLHGDDARPVLRWLPDSSLNRAFLLFPDPWPKARHHKRRLVSGSTLAELQRVLKPGAELRLATDIADYARAMLLAARAERNFQWIAENPSDWRERTPDWPPTRYEEKAVRDGRRCTFFRFRKR